LFNYLKMHLRKRYSIKIPKNVNVLYCSQKKILIVTGPLKRKSLKLNIQINVLMSEKLIIVSNSRFKTDSLFSNKQKKALRGTVTARIKQMLIEVSHVLHQKINFVGVGYRAFILENIKHQIMFKLGYSHPIYFKIPNFLKVQDVKSTKLFLYGEMSYDTLTQTTSSIRQCKVPEPYKGKGILREGEKILLKKGKKI